MCAADLSEAITAVADRPRKCRFACVRFGFTCVACGQRSPLNAFSERDEVVCLRCGQAQGLDADELSDVLATVHLTLDPRAEGRTIVDRRGEETDVDAVGARKTFFSYERDTLHASWSPGQPLCAGCRAPLDARLDRAALRTRCRKCRVETSYRLPASLASRAPALVGAIDDDNRVELPEARLIEGGADTDQVLCGRCGAPLGFDPHGPPVVDCGHCKTRSHLPRALLARASNAPRSEPIWLLFRGGSPRFDELERAAARERRRESGERGASTSRPRRWRLPGLPPGMWIQLVAVGGAGAVLGLAWLLKTPRRLEDDPASRIVSVCAPSAADATHALVIDEVPESYQVGQTSWSSGRRRARALEAATGVLGPARLLRALRHGEPREGTLPDCLGHAGDRVWMQTRRFDAELRDPRTGLVVFDADGIRARAAGASWSMVRHDVETGRLLLGDGAALRVLAPDTLTLAAPEPGLDRRVAERANWTIPRWPNVPRAARADGSVDPGCYALETDRLCGGFRALERRAPSGARRWRIEGDFGRFERVGATVVTWDEERTSLAGWDLGDGHRRWTLELGKRPR